MRARYGMISCANTTHFYHRGLPAAQAVVATENILADYTPYNIHRREGYLQEPQVIGRAEWIGPVHDGFQCGSKYNMYKELQETIAEMTAPGQMFSITEVNVGGHPVKAWAMAPNSLRDIWLARRGMPMPTTWCTGDERWTYARPMRRLPGLPTGCGPLVSANTIGVAIAMRNYPEWMLAYRASPA